MCATLLWSLTFGCKLKRRVLALRRLVVLSFCHVWSNSTTRIAPCVMLCRIVFICPILCKIIRATVTLPLSKKGDPGKTTESCHVHIALTVQFLKHRNGSWITCKGRRIVICFCARHLWVSQLRDGGAYLLSIAALPSPPPKEGREHLGWPTLVVGIQSPMKCWRSKVGR